MCSFLPAWSFGSSPSNSYQFDIVFCLLVAPMALHGTDLPGSFAGALGATSSQLRASAELLGLSIVANYLLYR